jgi:GNAT superfamily N-acetyltransferase
VGNQFVIRLAKWSDVERIVELSFCGRPENNFQDPLPQFIPDGYKAAFQRIDGDPNSKLIVVEKNGIVVGTFQMTYLTYISGNGKEVCQIESVFVDPDYRSEGVGTFMMNWAIAEARARHCQRVQLTTNKLRLSAHKFYRKLGFVLSHEGAKLDLSK